MSTIYEITGRLLQIIEMMEDPDMDPEVLKDTLESIEGELEDKIDGYGKVILQLESEIEAIQKEKKRLDAREKTLRSNIDRMKEIVKMSMIATGKKKIKSLLFSFSVAKNPVKMVIDDQTKIPALYYEVPEPKPELNKTLLKENLKNGEIIEGVHLEQGESLRIK